MPKNKTRCPHCGKFLIPYIKSSDVCQICYRYLSKKYSYYEYRENVDLPRANSKAEKIIEYAYKDLLDPCEIAKLTNANVIYVRTIIRKYLYKCDINGNPRPSYMREK